MQARKQDVFEEIQRLQQEIFEGVRGGLRDPYELVGLYTLYLDGKVTLRIGEQETSAAKWDIGLLLTPLSQLGLGNLRSPLRFHEVTNLGRIIQLSEDQLLSFRNFGKVSLARVQEVVAKHHLRLGTRLPPEVIAVVGEARWR